MKNILSNIEVHGRNWENLYFWSNLISYLWDHNQSYWFSFISSHTFLIATSLSPKTSQLSKRVCMNMYHYGERQVARAVIKARYMPRQFTFIHSFIVSFRCFTSLFCMYFFIYIHILSEITKQFMTLDAKKRFLSKKKGRNTQSVHIFTGVTKNIIFFCASDSIRRKSSRVFSE